MTFSFDKLPASMARCSLADAEVGRRVRVVHVELEGSAAAWLAAVGLQENEEVVVLRRAALGGPLHIRMGSGGELAVGREVATHIAVIDAQSELEGSV